MFLSLVRSPSFPASPTPSAIAAPASRRVRSLERWFLAGVALLVFLVSVRAAIKVADNRSAFRRWQPQIQQLEKGVDLSAAFNYPNPPMMAVLLEPFAWLAPLPGALAWFYVKAALAFVSLSWALRLVESPEQPFPSWAWMLVVSCSLKPIIDDLTHGNVNLFVLFLVMASLTSRHRGFDLLGGCLLGLAIACKLTPALFVPYFVWKRSWRLLAGCFLGIALFLYPGVVPALRLGKEENLRQLRSWYRGMVVPFLVAGKVTSEHANQSLPGLVSRLATRQPSFIAWKGDVEVAVRFDNLVDLSPRTARFLVQGCMAGFALLVVCTCRGNARTGAGMAAECAVVVLGMLLFSERTWKHHAVTLMLPFAVLVYHVAWGPRRASLVLLLVLACTLLVLPGLGSSQDRFASGADPGFAKLALVYGAYTWAFVLLLAGLGTILAHQARPGGARSATSSVSETEPALQAEPACPASLTQGIARP